MLALRFIGYLHPELPVHVEAGSGCLFRVGSGLLEWSACGFHYYT